MNRLDHEELKAKLNSETAKIAWSELQRFFAQGVIVAVDDSMDLVEVATQIASDNKDLIEKWMQSGSLHPVSNDAARQWYEQQASVWAVVVAPWVLVQAVPSDEIKQ